MPLPHPLLRRLLVRRGVSIWLGARVMFFAVTAFAAGMSSVLGPPTVRVPAMVALWLTGCCAVLVAADHARRRENVLLANLGFSALATASLGVIPAVLAEGLIFLFWPA